MQTVRSPPHSGSSSLSGQHAAAVVLRKIVAFTAQRLRGVIHLAPRQLPFQDSARMLRGKIGGPALGHHEVSRVGTLAAVLAALMLTGTTAASAQSGSCNIKGNVSTQGERIYHMPGDRYYEETRISASHGERWFCSEEEARAAGWRRARV